jgi:ketosteroid isomerase-like protein
MHQHPRETALAFVERINAHDVGRMLDLLTDDHEFIDAYDQKVTGRENLRKGWLGYFDWFPDFRIEVEHTMEDGDTIALFGHAGGTFKGVEDHRHHWRLPGAWRVVVRNGRIRTWQVYADTKIVFDIINRKMN